MRVNYLFPLLVLGVIGAMAFTGCGEDAPQLTEGQRAAAAAWAELAAASEALGYIPSSKAAEHMGEEVTVRGNITDYQYNSDERGKPYTLLFNNPGVAESGSPISDLETSKAFKVVILKESRENFPPNFAAGYAKNMGCATGMIMEYNGSPAIEAQNPSQLKIGC